MDQTTRQGSDVAYPQVSAVGAQRAFSTAMVISGIRCLFAYVVLPFVAPIIGLAPAVGPWLGLAISAVAIVANVFSIRRFARSRHRLRKLVIPINVAVIGFMLVLIAIDLGDALQL